MGENHWKNFPKHKPSKTGLYRVEYDCADHHWYQCWYWAEDAWVEENFRGCLIHLQNKRNIRFKPWDVEETDESKVVLTCDEAKAIHKYLWGTVGTIRVNEAQSVLIDSFIKKVCRIEESEKQ